MKRCASGIAALLLLLVLPLRVWAADSLIPVGKVVGLQLSSGSICVAAIDDILGKEAREAGLLPGDEILEIDGACVDSAAGVIQSIRGKKAARLKLRRGSRQLDITLPVHETAGGPRLGIYLREGVSGIGTVTWYDPETGVFGALGHGVSDSSGGLADMRSGSAFAARVESVRRGAPGQPGQLRGSAGEIPFASLYENTPQGLFGIADTPFTGQALPLAEYADIKTGSAVILSTVAGNSPREYSVELLKIYPEDRPDGRNFLLRVTDEDLLASTGGIVQGMSGSPIIQNGRLIGAVTHVLVNNPDTGYGIFIENMLEAAG